MEIGKDENKEERQSINTNPHVTNKGNEVEGRACRVGYTIMHNEEKMIRPTLNTGR